MSPGRAGWWGLAAGVGVFCAAACRETRPTGLEIPADRAAKVSALAAWLEAAEDPMPRLWLARNARPAPPMRAAIRALSPLGAGVLADVTFTTPDGSGRIALQGAWVGPSPEGEWVVIEQPTLRTLSTSTGLGLSGTLVLDDAGRLHADVELELDVKETGPVPVSLRFDGDVEQRTLEVSEAGGPRPFVASGEVVTVVPSRAGRVKERFRYVRDLHPASGQAILTGMGRPLPMLWSENARTFELVVEHSAHWTIAANGRVEPLPAAANGNARFRMRLDHGFPLWVAYEHPARRAVPGEVRPAEVITSAEREVELDRAARAVAEALEKLSALGEFPTPRIIAAEGAGLNTAQGSEGLLLLPEAFDWEVPVITHELGHHFFPGVVSRGGSMGSVDWTESLPEYVAGWTAERPWLLGSQRLADYGELPNYAIVDDRLPQVTREVRDVMKYRKGPALLSSLEARIGRDAVARVLRGFIEARRDTTGSWEELAASVGRVAGEPEERWFRERLRCTPALELRDVVVKRGRLKGRIAVNTDGCGAGFEHPDRVPLVMIDLAGGALDTHLVTVPQAGATIDVPIPAGAQGAQLDPEVTVYRYPSKRPDGDAIYWPPAGR